MNVQNTKKYNSIRRRYNNVFFRGKICRDQFWNKSTKLFVKSTLFKEKMYDKFDSIESPKQCSKVSKFFSNIKLVLWNAKLLVIKFFESPIFTMLVVHLVGYFFFYFIVIYLCFQKETVARVEDVLTLYLDIIDAVVQWILGKD